MRVKRSWEDEEVGVMMVGVIVGTRKSHWGRDSRCGGQ